MHKYLQYKTAYFKICKQTCGFDHIDFKDVDKQKANDMKKKKVMHCFIKPNI